LLHIDFEKNEKGDFLECLSRLECDVLLMFGADDPWCKPAFGRKMLKALNQRGTAAVQRYIELENVGHCPNHEAPEAVARVTSSWVQADNRHKDQLRLIQQDKEVIHEPWGEIVIREKKEDEIQLSLMDRIATTFV
jgi:hypothetical protein